MNPTAGPPLDDFTRTRWSLVRQLQTADTGGASVALAELAARYGYPVYAYVRRCGHAVDAAQAITRAFLQRVAADLRDDRNPPVSRFREWLLMRLNAFLSGERTETAGPALDFEIPAAAQLEARNREEHEPGESPELAYRRSFALEVLARGLVRLRAEAAETGRLDMCEVLEAFLTHDPLPGQYDELSQRLHVRPLALVLALKRLRERFRELVREELADTVASAGDMDAEQQRMLDALEPVAGP
jgi:RNA polymerase sigma-70 factor (ECF subfamily)